MFIAGFFCNVVVVVVVDCGICDDCWFIFMLMLIFAFKFSDCWEDNNFSLSYSFLKMALTDLREFLFTAIG